MKTIILQGDNVEESRRRLQKFIDTANKRGWRVEKIVGGEGRMQDFLSANTLFDSERLFVLENPKKLTSTDLEFVKKFDRNEDTLVIYATNILSKSFLKGLGNVQKIETFEYPKLIWKFLDSFYPPNANNSIRLMHQVIQKDAVELVFALLARHLKDLYQVKTDKDSISLPSWRVGKLQSQASKFDRENLQEIINQMAEIDVMTKTGEGDLVQLLDFLMIEKLE